MIKIAARFPEVGYYQSKGPVFGKRGDFITAPHISQLFGEIVACWLADKMNPGKKYVLLELGPGDGTLLQDIISTIQKLELWDCIDRIDLHECSESLKDRQRRILQNTGARFEFVEHLSPLRYQGENVLFLANEFFDSLPVHCFYRNGIGAEWSEVLVDYKDRFYFLKSVPDHKLSRLYNLQNLFPRQEDSVEICPEAWRYSNQIGSIATACDSFFGLIFDYGIWGPSKWSLRAIKNHKILSDPLESLGQADLTTNVDFQALAHIFGNYLSCGITTQKRFLLSNGIKDRISRSSRAKDPSVIGAANRLLEDMGEIFKVLILKK